MISLSKYFPMKKYRKKVLDVCCGPRMMWFDKENPLAMFVDIRKESFIACDGRTINIDPDLIADFRSLPFDDNSFKLVVFDPPHDRYAGKNSFLAQKYGKLSETWESDLSKGFNECMRVLCDDGILIFKWNEIRFPVSRILSLFNQDPLFGHKSGKASKTHWLCFMKNQK